MYQRSSSFGRRQVLALLALGALATPSLVRAAGGPTDAPRIAGEEAVKLAAKGEAVIVDVRAKSDYDFEHAEGAVSIPLAELEARIGELPKNKLIAAYCTWGAEGTSARAAQQLIEKGYPKAAAIKGGLSAWKTAGGKTASTKK